MTEIKTRALQEARKRINEHFILQRKSLSALDSTLTRSESEGLCERLIEDLELTDKVKEYHELSRRLYELNKEIIDVMKPWFDLWKSMNSQDEARYFSYKKKQCECPESFSEILDDYISCQNEVRRKETGEKYNKLHSEENKALAKLSTFKNEDTMNAFVLKILESE